MTVFATESQAIFFFFWLCNDYDVITFDHNGQNSISYLVKKFSTVFNLKNKVEYVILSRKRYVWCSTE